jgi:2-polyprenyl-3-methyl-5-hydroxy-6-metoxy-1,4-benzoquinol methylase
MSDPCDVCGTSSLQPWLSLSLSEVYDVNVARCSGCGFRQVRPRLAREAIASLYPPGYFDPASGLGFTDYARQQQHHEREARFLSAQLASISPGGRLLEVGCGPGFLLEALERYSDWTHTGVDISPTAARYARKVYGCDVECGTLEEARFGEGDFDFVVQKDVLEHVAQPKRHLLETHRILRPGGYTQIVTPNGEANLRPLEALSPTLPAHRLPLLTQGHLSFFAMGHLERLFSDCGFECVRARSISVRRGLRALGYFPLRKQRVPDARRSGRLPTDVAPLSGEAAHPDIDDIRTRLEAAIRERKTRLRTSTAYGWYRRTLERLDSLPARMELGNDFEFLLRKPR